jgi:hypothetical protein
MSNTNPTAGLAVPASCKIPTGVTHWGDQPLFCYLLRYFSIIMVSMPSLIVVEHGFEPRQVNLNAMKLVSVDSSLRT